MRGQQTDFPLQPTGAACRERAGTVNMIMEALVTFETQVATALKPDLDDLVPSEALPRQSSGRAAGTPTFPKVLRGRLDEFFADQNISPKADRTMWIKIATGLAVLAGSWIGLYAFNPSSWRFVALY